MGCFFTPSCIYPRFSLPVTQRRLDFFLFRETEKEKGEFGEREFGEKEWGASRSIP
jgi:hypothetical protein